MSNVICGWTMLKDSDLRIATSGAGRGRRVVCFFFHGSLLLSLFALLLFLFHLVLLSLLIASVFHFSVVTLVPARALSLSFRSLLLSLSPFLSLSSSLSLAPFLFFSFSLSIAVVVPDTSTQSLARDVATPCLPSSPTDPFARIARTSSCQQMRQQRSWRTSMLSTLLAGTRTRSRTSIRFPSICVSVGCTGA